MMGMYLPWGMGYGWMGWMMAGISLYWVVSLVFILWSLIHIARSRQDAGYKVIWAGIVVILGLIGVLIYYVVEAAREKDTRYEAAPRRRQSVDDEERKRQQEVRRHRERSRESRTIG